MNDELQRFSDLDRRDLLREFQEYVSDEGRLSETRELNHPEDISASSSEDRLKVLIDERHLSVNYLDDLEEIIHMFMDEGYHLAYFTELMATPMSLGFTIRLGFTEEEPPHIRKVDFIPDSISIPRLNHFQSFLYGTPIFHSGGNIGWGTFA